MRKNELDFATSAGRFLVQCLSTRRAIVSIAAPMLIVTTAFTSLLCAQSTTQRAPAPPTAYDNTQFQPQSSGGFQSPFAKNQFNAGQPAAPKDPWKFEGRLHLEKGTNGGYLVLQVDLDPEHYIYSVSPTGSPAPTKISVVPNPAIATHGLFSPNVQPAVNENDPVFRRRIEKHKGTVQFFVRCQIDANMDLQPAGMPTIEFNGQVCSEGGVCIPINAEKVSVKFAGYFERKAQSASKPQPTGAPSR